jgi:hypothetical protein
LASTDAGFRVCYRVGAKQENVETVPQEVVSEERSPAMPQFDLSNPTYAKLASYAARAAALLKLPKVRENGRTVGPLDDFLGIVYALMLANQFDFKDRTEKKIEITPVEKRASELALGKLRPDGKWMAGFHFNSALYRTSAVYHRILQVIAGKDDEMKNLRAIAKDHYRQWRKADWSDDHLFKVYQQVNVLKHRPQGVHDRRMVKYREALAAPGELLDLLEASLT